MQITTDLTYLFLNAILLLTFVVSGQLVSRKANYWSCATCCIVAFTLIQGLRYGRGNDYQHYTEVFMGIDQQSNALFLWLNSVLMQIGIDKHTCFVFYAFVFSSCSMVFLQNYKECAKWVFPLYIVGFIFFNEYQIRQAFSYSFFFLYMHYLFQVPLDIRKVSVFDTKYVVLALIAAILCVKFHSANVFILATFSVVYFFVRKPLTYWIAIPIYLSFVYVIPKVFDFSIIELFFVFFSDTETLKEYIENADRWFSESAMEDIYTRNPIIQIFEAFGVSSLLYLGYKHITNKAKPHFPAETAFYYSFFIGVCILSAFRKLELMNRMGYDLSLLLYILLGIVLYSRHREVDEALLPYSETEEENENEENGEYYVEAPVSTPSVSHARYTTFVAYIPLIWFVYDYLKYILWPGKLTLFLWDVPLIHSY